MAREIPDVAATFPMPKDIAAELLLEQEVAAAVIPEDLPQIWKDRLRAEVARICDDRA